MKNLILIFMLAVNSLNLMAAHPTHVIITAGQSNTDGRTPNEHLPQYIKALATDTAGYAEGAYRYCRIAQNDAEGKFIPFWPRAMRNGKNNMWAFDAVTYYGLEQLFGEEYYVIKWAVGGTSIAPNYNAAKGRFWSADPAWLAKTKATSEGGNSLLLSFIKEIDVCIDRTLSKLEGGYQIDAFLWHQGESDYAKSKDYYHNLKTVVAYVRTHLTEKTGKDYSKLPFVFGTVARSNKYFSTEVEDAMKRLAEEDADMHLIDMSGAELLGDKLHFTAHSAEYLGNQVYKQLERIIKGEAGQADGLKGKRLGIIGDSYVKNHREPVENTWHYKFAKKHGMEYFNYGKNGSSIAYSSPRWGEAMYLRYKDMPDSLDYVVVVGGHNDGFKLDSIGGLGIFKEKLSVLCEGLIGKYPTAKIFFFTRWNCKDFKGSDSEKVVDAMIEVCGNYNIPIFDCARKGSIYASDDNFRRIYFQKSKNNTDTAHLNEKGHERFLKVAESFILQY